MVAQYTNSQDELLRAFEVSENKLYRNNNEEAINIRNAAATLNLNKLIKTHYQNPEPRNYFH